MNKPGDFCCFYLTFCSRGRIPQRQKSLREEIKRKSYKQEIRFRPKPKAKICCVSFVSVIAIVATWQASPRFFSPVSSLFGCHCGPPAAFAEALRPLADPAETTNKKSNRREKLHSSIYLSDRDTDALKFLNFLKFKLNKIGTIIDGIGSLLNELKHLQKLFKFLRAWLVHKWWIFQFI